MDKENVVYLHNGVIHRKKKLMTFEICGQMGGSRKHHIEEGNPDPK